MDLISPIAPDTIVGDRALTGAGPGRERSVNTGAGRSGYQGMSVTETSRRRPGSRPRLPAGDPASGRAAAMESREFDYNSLVRPMESRMMRSIWRIVRQREAAEDALQDALAVIWKKRDAVARHPNPHALILKIAVAAAYDAVRRNRRRLRYEIAGLPGSRPTRRPPPATRGRRTAACGPRSSKRSAACRDDRPRRFSSASSKSSPTRRSPGPWIARRRRSGSMSCGPGRR